MAKVTMKHIREAGICARGLVAFAVRHSLDRDRFFREGLDTEELKDIDDEMVRRVIAIAEADHEENNG